MLVITNAIHFHSEYIANNGNSQIIWLHCVSFCAATSHKPGCLGFFSDWYVRKKEYLNITAKLTRLVQAGASVSVWRHLVTVLRATPPAPSKCTLEYLEAVCVTHNRFSLREVTQTILEERKRFLTNLHAYTQLK